MMRILAAGSLRAVWPRLMAEFQADAVCEFGPAGLLRERIEASSGNTMPDDNMNTSSGIMV